MPKLVIRSDELRAIRQSKYLTQAELGEIAGVTEQTINRLEKGLHAPQIGTIRKIAKALAVEPTLFSEWVDDPQTTEAADS